VSPRRPDLPSLRRDALAADPFAQFASWYEEALLEVPLADAVTLATVGPDGAPDARMVLLKGHRPDGFRFFTNRESAKARQLAADRRAALVVYWRELDRQVRIRGEVEPLSDLDSDAYFATRPRDSQLSAWASPQSRPLESRAELDRRFANLGAEYAEAAVPRPPFWGGYLLVPATVEFWQGRIGRLHDRFLYSREDGGWSIVRLAP
jgi:pyridoxamine 5'-phosphate oxidase